MQPSTPPPTPPPAKNRRRVIILIVITFTCMLLVIGLSNWSAIGTQLANPMRDLLGVRRVAQLETLLFNIQDQITQWKYKAGFSEPEALWGAEPQAEVDYQQTPAGTQTAPPDPTSTISPSPNPENGLVNPTSETPGPSPTVAATATPATWTLPNVPPFGDLDGEGVWQPYITNPQGEVVALRTFLQPDTERPYTLVAVVAIDLTRTKLHYVLGLKEPSKPGGPHGQGIIPAEDRQPGKLLAAFNGGFIAEHGGYGAMADGITPLAASAGLATLAIYNDGSVRIGEWGNDFYVGEDYRAWRQNALMIIHNGEINPKVETGSWIEWGANLDGATVTLRSSVGLNEDGEVLYYFAGPNLSMPVLANAMLAAGVYNGMLLDINPTHAHFTAMRVVDEALVAEVLYEEEMNLWIDRYLGQWKLDFFYVTTKE